MDVEMGVVEWIAFRLSAKISSWAKNDALLDAIHFHRELLARNKLWREFFGGRELKVTSFAVFFCVAQDKTNKENYKNLMYD